MKIPESHSSCFSDSHYHTTHAQIANYTTQV